MADLDLTFAALADRTRRAILARLAEGEATVGELAAPFTLSAPTISKHLRMLERASLIKIRKNAQWRHCRLSGAPLDEARDWIARMSSFWEESLDGLEALAKRTARNAPAPRRRKK